MNQFSYTTYPQKVIFGESSLLELAVEVKTAGYKRILLVTSGSGHGYAEKLMSLLSACHVRVFDKAVMHVPIEYVEQAIKVGHEHNTDCVIAIGGGSAIGMGKALALKTGVPVIAIPVTYAGSEMTQIYGLTEANIKTTGRSPVVLPGLVIYDPLLSLNLPLDLTVVSGINAIAHAVESLYAHDRSPITESFAIQGVLSLMKAIPVIEQCLSEGAVSTKAYVNARSQALYGAWMCGAVLGSTSMGLHHKLCHVLGGSFNLPHASLHTVMLPHAIAYNQSETSGQLQKLNKALEVADLAQTMFEFSARHGASVALKELGMHEKDLDLACELAMQKEYPNPRKIEQKPLRQLLQNAYEGLPPERGI
ncbi:maleylacetate reductase [Advenella sp. WQ 585]|uniref:Maleylacetate reductase n=2 Tax=Advenella mandrilli TaxID=2800330 RepID=A0ABS1EHG8_9BURK|nr:maleylacetate reductase [Advenella mandrilli]